MKRILFLLMTTISITAIAITGCDNTVNNNNEKKEKLIPLENIEFNIQNITLILNDNSALSVTKFPLDATDKLVWESDDPETVSVDQTGKITGLQMTNEDNEVEIIVKSDNNPEISAKCYVKVVSEDNYIPVTGLTLTPSTLNLKMGQTVTGQLAASVLPENATDQKINWTTSDASVAEVSANGQVTALRDGNATISAISNNGGFNKICYVTVDPAEQVIIGSGIKIIDHSGWLETLFVKWKKMGAASYNVYYKGGGITNWIKIDTPLIREYGDYYRADILGLKAGLYDVEVRAVDDSGNEFADNGSVSNIHVEAHIRSGFAFANNKTPGAYNSDGTIKTGARIIYITEQNKETVTLAMRRQNASSEQIFTGLQNILTAYEGGYESRPTIIRVIGKVNEKKGLPFTDDEGSVMIKGNSNTGRPVNTEGMNLTIEGVGDDAVAYGWGIRSSRANSVEIRNLGLILSNTSQKDAIELTTNSVYMWVHNNDIFYGRPGSASDQKKGDGSLDIKTGDFITISFNHFWDTGKSNLLGNGVETPGNLTYHHNWYDHSDSRHPRVRFHNVHVYNNFFDGVGKYGIGATRGSSVFSDRNYFLNSRKPMLISMQGTDIAGSGGGTFSSEAGGIIKSYGNVMSGVPAGDMRPWSESNQTEFDFYTVTNPSDPVPASVTTKVNETSGSARSTYNNDFLTYDYTADSAEDAKIRVIKYSGRYWGGDFKYIFPAGSDTHVDDPMPDLLSELQSYSSKLVSIQGGSNPNGGDPGGSDPGGEDPGGGDNPIEPPVEGAVICSFGMTGSSGSSVYATNNFFTLTSANGTKPSGGKIINGITYDVALKVESGTIISFNTTGPMKITLYLDVPNNNIGINGTNVSTNAEGIASTDLAAGSHEIRRGGSGSKNLWLIVLEPK